MDKKYSIIANSILLVWFFLNMIGLYFGESYLVTRSWREDGIFFLIFLFAFIVFLVKEKSGKYILSIVLSIWLIVQFFSHEWFTIVGGGEGKIRYFENAIKWIDLSNRYIPDVYHSILHFFILIALGTTLVYSVKSRESNS